MGLAPALLLVTAGSRPLQVLQNILTGQLRCKLTPCVRNQKSDKFIDKIACATRS
jgi:hypothetical protein